MSAEDVATSGGGHRPTEGDGRNVDPRVGILEGEAADQTAPARRSEAEGAAPFEVWRMVPSGDGDRRTDPTYYDRPAIKEPVWIWSVPAYFYVGGAAGAANVLGAVAQLVDREGMDGLVRRCRWIGAVGGGLGTAFLVIDLGRPERFLNMLRVFRPTSPLSLGSWVLAAATPAASGAAALSGAGGALRALADAAGLGAGLVGLPLSGYTAVLLSSTAVPIWQETRRTLPMLFVASAMSSAASLLELTGLNRREEEVVHRFGLAGKIAGMAAMVAVEKEASRVDRVGRPLREGVSGALWRSAKVLAGASLGLSLWPGRSRARTVARAVLGTAGAIAVRFAVMRAGKASAQDPRATFHMQRAGRGGREVTGRPATAGPPGSA
ncbi:MAG: polysulfide reductase NrfD [Actinobacteria bacterium]|nr:polysulfide reductase NrfD [Actinomycetota bacterium]